MSVILRAGLMADPGLIFAMNVKERRITIAPALREPLRTEKSEGRNRVDRAAPEGCDAVARHILPNEVGWIMRSCVGNVMRRIWTYELEGGLLN